MQDSPRLHYPIADDAPLAEALSLTLDAGQAHYLGSVLRREPGDRVRLFNEQDGEWEAEIATLRKERCAVRLLARVRAPAPEPGPHLLFAPLKRDATDLVVRMATELGVAVLQPLITERTNTARTNPERWIAIATEAAEQCERLSVPRIAEPVRLPDLLGGWNHAVPLLAALERATDAQDRGEGSGDTRIVGSRWRADTDAAIQPGVLIGPEGGFSAVERRLLLSRPFVVPIRLGFRVLRAETAACAALAALLE